MLQNGIGTEKDIGEAKQYYEQSTKLGNALACYSLAKLILAEEGNEYAAYQLGKLYLKGEDITKDVSSAIKWLKLSSEKGNQF